MVIPYFEQPQRVIGAVRSVLRQTDPVRRILVLSDGDDTVPEAGLVRMDSARVIVHRLPWNRGNYFVREVAWRALDDGWIAFLDADDVVRRDWMSKLSAAAASHGGAAFSAMRIVRSVGPLNRTVKVRSVRPDLAAGQVPHHFAIHNGLFRRERIDAAGGFDPSFRIGYDTLFVNLVALTGPFGVVDEPVYIRRQRDLLSGRRSLTQDPLTGKGTPYRRGVSSEVEMMYAAYAPRFRSDPTAARRALVAARDPGLEAEVRKCVTVLQEVLDERP